MQARRGRPRLVMCSACGTMNRIFAHARGFRLLCGRCGAPIVEDKWQTESKRERGMSSLQFVVEESEPDPRVVEGPALAVLADQLCSDLQGLIRAGIVIDRTTQAAEVGGVAAAAGAYYFGHPFLSILFGGLAIIADKFAESEKNVRLAKTRAKWIGICNMLGADGTMALAEEIRRRYPAMLGGAVSLLAPPNP